MKDNYSKLAVSLHAWLVQSLDLAGGAAPVICIVQVGVIRTSNHSFKKERKRSQHKQY